MAPSYARLGPWLAAGTLLRLRHQGPAVPWHLPRHCDRQATVQQPTGLHVSSHCSSMSVCRSPTAPSVASVSVRNNCQSAQPHSSALRYGGGRSRLRAGRDRPRAPHAPHPTRGQGYRCLWGPSGAVAEEEGVPGAGTVRTESGAGTEESTPPTPEADSFANPKPHPDTPAEGAEGTEGVPGSLQSIDAGGQVPGEGPRTKGGADSAGRGQGSGGGGTKGSSGSNRGGAPRVKLKRGQDVELVCDSLAFKGLGVCRVEGTGFVVLCERALPGERLIARVTKSKQSFAEAYKLTTLSPHRDAADPPCAHFGACGGCKLQNLQYPAQLAAKQQQVEDLMLRVGGFGAHEEPGYIKPIIGCDQVYHYRNKMEFSFGARIWSPTPPPDRKAAWGKPVTELPPPTGSDTGGAAQGEGPPLAESPGRGGALGEVPEAAAEAAGGLAAVVMGSAVEAGEGEGAEGPPPRGFALGLHAPKRFDKILSIDECLLQDPTANEILAYVRDYCKQRPQDLPAYDPVLHTGFMRHLTIRTGANPESGELEIMVNLATKADKPSLLRPLAEELCQHFPAVVSVLNTVNTSLSDVAPAGGTPHVLQGAPTISVPLRGLLFEVSASSFFQTNTAQAEVLYREVEAACALRGDRSEVVLDLFCGTGSIGLSLAPKVRQVYGYEIVPEAVADARRNARRNGITNAEFLEGDLNRVLPTAHQGQPGDDRGTVEQEEQGPEGAVVGSLARPDVIITDPNRPGMHPKLLKHIAEVRAPRIVYVSCNPSTCARDMSVLCHGEDGSGTGPYKLVSVQPVDMFPHTPHIECVAILVLRQ